MEKKKKNKKIGIQPLKFVFCRGLQKKLVFVSVKYLLLYFKVSHSFYNYLLLVSSISLPHSHRQKCPILSFVLNRASSIYLCSFHCICWQCSINYYIISSCSLTEEIHFRIIFMWIASQASSLVIPLIMHNPFYMPGIYLDNKIIKSYVPIITVV